MRPNLKLDTPSHSSPTCYFTYQPSSSHFSVETPNTTPLSAYSPDTFPDPSNPLLAFRPPPPPESHSSSLAMDASKLLQLQTAAAHARPIIAPLHHSSSVSSSSSLSSASSSPSPPTLCCSRCRRTSIGSNGMVRFGTNLYYCSHCASMTGYNAG